MEEVSLIGMGFLRIILFIIKLTSTFLNLENIFYSLFYGITSIFSDNFMFFAKKIGFPEVSSLIRRLNFGRKSDFELRTLRRGNDNDFADQNTCSFL